MNRYGLPLINEATQTILPVMTEDGRVHGWFAMNDTFAAGFTEGTFDAVDNELTLKTVTAGGAPTLKQFVAAVYPSGLPHNSKPWASEHMIEVSDGMYRWWSLPTQGWKLHEGGGLLVEGLLTDLNIANAAALVPPAAPNINQPEAIVRWGVTVQDLLFNGACPYFDFNWLTLYNQGEQDLRIKGLEIVKFPEIPDGYTSVPFTAQLVGAPTAMPGSPTSPGNVLYDTLRITSMYKPPEGLYVFEFAIIMDPPNDPVTVEFTIEVPSNS